MIGIKSRYNRSTLIMVYDLLGRLSRRPYLDIWPRYEKRTAIDDRQYQIEDGDNWSRIAHKFLGDGHHWWIIAEMNKVVDPWRDLYTLKGDATNKSTKITIPSMYRTNFDILDFYK
jgi:hypothetical protein